METVHDAAVGGLSPQLMVALKSARRLAISAARSLAKRCLTSEVTLVSPLRYRTKGLPSLKGGLVRNLYIRRFPKYYMAHGPLRPTLWGLHHHQPCTRAILRIELDRPPEILLRAVRVALLPSPSSSSSERYKLAKPASSSPSSSPSSMLEREGM